MTEKSNVALAKSISVYGCKHGNVYVRLHDVNGKIFAAGIVDKHAALDVSGQILDAINSPDDCDEVH